MPWFWIFIIFIVAMVLTARSNRRRYIRDGIKKLEQFINARDENDDD